MVSTKSLARNTLYFSLAAVGQKAIAFIYFTIVARYFGQEGTGDYFLALAIVLICAVLIDLGMSGLMIREVAKKAEDAKDWARTMIGWRVITIPVAIGVAILAPILLGYDTQLTHLVWLATIVMSADSISLAMYGILRGLHNLKYESLGIFVGQSLTAGLGIFLIATDQATLPLLILALIIGSSWNMLFSSINVVRNLGWQALVPSYKFGTKPIKMAFAFFLATIFVKIYSYVDSLLLEHFIGSSEVGVYAVAYKLTYAFQFLPLAFIAALYPTMSSQAHDANRLKRTLLQSFWYLALIGMPIVFGIWSIAPELIVAVYSAEFTASILPLQILIFVLIPIFLDFPVGSLLNATGRQHLKTGVMGVAMIINIAVNILLIPTLGAVGASVAGLISFSFLFVAGWYFVQRAIDVTIGDLFKQIGGLVVSAVVMALVVLLLKPMIHFVLAIPLGAIVYLAMAFATRSLTMNHIRSMRALLRRKPYVPAEDITSNA